MKNEPEHLVELDFSDSRQKDLYDRVISYTREIYGLNDVLKGHPEKRIESVTVRRKKELIARVEALISKVYKLEF